MMSGNTNDENVLKHENIDTSSSYSMGFLMIYWRESGVK
jgi:hypothetical protein